MKKQTILLVDDEIVFVQSIKNYILKKETKYLIKTAYNGKEALKILENEKIDLVVLDINMPVMNGIQLLTELYNRDHWLPIIILTCVTFEKKEEAYKTFGIVEFLNKPIVLEGLFLRIRKILKIRENRDIIYDMSLKDMIQILEVEKITGVLTVNFEEGDGRLFFKKGEFVGIVVEGLSEEEAIAKCLKSDNEVFKISMEYIDHSRDKKIKKPW
jgi:response regulator RpfG family c-di-GMP phosphodiesterase